MPGSCGDPTAGATARFTAPEARNSAFAAPDGRRSRVSRIRQWGTAPASSLCRFLMEGCQQHACS